MSRRWGGMSRRWPILTAALAMAVGLAAAAPALGQSPRGGAPRPPLPGTAPDPIGQSRALSSRPVLALPPPPSPEERLVPERRVLVPGTRTEIVIPSHYERRLSDQRSQVPPLTGYGTRGEAIIHLPGGERPPAELRQSP